MKKRNRLVACVLSLSLIVAAAIAVHAQSGTIKTLRGDTLQPAFEGWEKNADGTYSFWFGYLNRNWDEELNIPVGPSNNIEPGGPDRGQPEIFQTGEQKRRQMFAFRVVVPAEWPKDRDLVWSVTSAGKTLKAYASLRPDYMIDVNVISANRGAQRDTDPVNKNTPPVIIEAPGDQTVAAETPLTLKVAVTDDGNPKPLRERRGESGTRDVKQLLRVSWLQWRGPGHVKFDPEVVPITDADGKYSRVAGTATTKATFDKPGTYALVLYAEDISLFSMRMVKVTVAGDAASK
ncbi:MAG: hypothetical protein HY047_19850 [Acidobacteria bacterium]|nr:hypothetical protein [Acidobacteriota bacterium]